jgi:hypothetical protein
MISEFSEFTYGYALVEELSRSTSFTAVPTFPSLVEEGRIGGYDVNLTIDGMPFFLQFKKSDYLSRSNAKYYSSFNGSYYRFHLHALRHSQQHNLLLHLERSGNPVFYVAPRFHRNIELHDNYFSSNVASSSIWVAPTEIGNFPDDDEHEICFNRSANTVFFCSEPKIVENKFSYAKGNMKSYIKIFKERNGYRQFHKENWQELYEQMEYILKLNDLASFSKLSIFLSQEKDIVLKTAKLSRLAFGADIIVYSS